MCEYCGCDHTSLRCPKCGGAMILINNRPVCPSCDNPHTAGEGHHHHEHHHSGEPGGKSDKLARLRFLLPYWIEHNAEHASKFREWAAEARGMKLDSVAAHIDEAIEMIEACNKALNKALEALEG